MSCFPLIEKRHSLDTPGVVLNKLISCGAHPIKLLAVKDTFGDNADSPRVGIATARKLNFSIENTTAFNTVGATSTGARISARSTKSSGTVTGIFNNAQGGSTSEGIVSRASGENISIGVHGITPQTTNNTFSVAIYEQATDTDNNRFAGLFEGDVTVTGGTFIASDRKLKQEITTEKSVLEKIALLNPVTYSFKDTEGIILPTTAIQHGFISQEMAEVFPELTKHAQNTLDQKLHLLVEFKF